MSLNLWSDNIINCEEIMTVVKEQKKIINCKKKRILNLTYNKGFLFKKFKEPD